MATHGQASGIVASHTSTSADVVLAAQRSSEVDS
jgi:hypothetical protein